MTAFYPQTWERNLLSLANRAASSPVPTSTHAIADPALLRRAYAYCDALTAEHSRSFHFASALLPREKRRAIRALYAFCRVSDNIVDCPNGDAAPALAAWRKRALSLQPAAEDLVTLAWTDTRMRFRIPPRFADQLIDGVARDLDQKRYQTFEELTAYCYGVASTVGLMSMHILGYAGAEAMPYAIKLGVALQLTNILRDVGEDWRAGRVYLPQQELAAFGLREADIAEERVHERWREFMRFQIARNRALYEQALPGIRMLNADGRFAVAAAAELYRAILDEIAANDYDVFKHRAHLTRGGKLSRLPGIWWRTRRT